MALLDILDHLVSNALDMFTIAGFVRPEFDSCNLLRPNQHLDGQSRLIREQLVLNDQAHALPDP
jgi:hypothetical protein